MTPEQLMKKCQIGCHKLDDANNLLAECYGTIGLLLNKLAEIAEDAEDERIAAERLANITPDTVFLSHEEVFKDVK